jgi:MFS family permease
MQDVLGYSPLMSGLAVVPMGLTVIVSSTITGKLMPRYGIRPFLVFGMPLIAIGVLMWAWTPVDGNYLLHVLPGIVVMSVGQGTTFPALTAASLADVPQNQHGVAGAANVTTQQIGSSIGVSALVAVAAAFTTPGETGELAGFHAAYIVAAVVVLVGTAGIAVILRRPSPARAAETVPVSG